jgi:hypothetical protein
MGSLRLTRRRLVALAVLSGVLTLTGAAIQASTAQATVTSVNDHTTGTGSNQFDFHGTWTQETDSSGVGAYNNDDTYSNTTSDYYLVRFTGTSITLYDVLNSGGGQGSAQICNSSGTGCGSATTINDYSATRTGNQQVYTSGTLTSGNYSLKVTVTGVNGSGGYHYLAPDRVAIDNGSSSSMTGTYYVDNGAGSGCSNSNNGTSSSTPWCDFTNINAGTFGAGAQILLKRGDTWSSGLTLQGGGTSWSSGGYVTVDAYGSGAKPAISLSSGGNDICVYGQDLDFWTFNNLDLSHCVAGIGIEYKTLGHQGLRFNGIYAHAMNNILFGQSSTPPTKLPGLHYGTGIYVSSDGTGTPTSTQWVYKDVQINDYEATGVDDGFEFSAGGFSSSFPPNSVQNVTVTRAYLHGNDGCPLIVNTTGFTVLDSVYDANGSRGQSVGTTGMWFWEDKSFSVINNVLGDTPNTSSSDETGTDVEGYDDSGAFRGNYIAGDAGSGVEVLGLGGRPGDFQTNHELSDNAFSDNDASGTSNSVGSIWMDNQTGISYTGTVANNLYAEPNTVLLHTNGSNSFTVSNNLSISSTGDLYNAGSQYSSTQGTNQWGYQYYNGSGWSNLSYDSTNAWWGTSSGYVNRFESLPNATSTNWVAHTWTAPKSGTVSIRGRVLKTVTGGDGVSVRITKNGTQIWPVSGGAQSLGASDQTGYATDLDNITVSSGDVIRFEVNDGGSSSNTSDLTSWNPSIGYTASSGGASVNDNTTGTASNEFDYHGTWTNESDTGGVGAYNNDDTYSDTTNDYYLVRFTGTGITLYDVLNPGGGQASGQICNSSGTGCGSATTINDYAATRIGNQQVYSSGTLTSGSYSLKVTVTGVNGAGGAHYVAPDRVVIAP